MLRIFLRKFTFRLEIFYFLSTISHSFLDQNDEEKFKKLSSLTTGFFLDLNAFFQSLSKDEVESIVQKLEKSAEKKDFRENIENQRNDRLTRELKFSEPIDLPDQ